MKLKNRIGLDCTLKLALAPMSIEDFSYLTTDKELFRILNESSLYMIVKRSCILFKDLSISNEIIRGKIIQIGNQNVIEFVLTIYQNDIVTGSRRDLDIKISYNNNYRQYLTIMESSELSQMDYIDAIFISESEANGGNHISYITPDTIIERYYSHQWICTISGNFSNFLNFEVLYVGEAVRSKIWKRLEKHSTLQKILSREQTSHSAIQIAHEINLLFFEIKYKSDTRMINGMSAEEIIGYLTQKDFDESVLFLDIEKAFISFLKPKYNIQLYNNYPESVNGIMPKGYKYIQYSIFDPILLKSEKEFFNSNPYLNFLHTLIVDLEKKNVTKVEIS